MPNQSAVNRRISNRTHTFKPGSNDVCAGGRHWSGQVLPTCHMSAFIIVDGRWPPVAPSPPQANSHLSDPCETHRAGCMQRHFVASDRRPLGGVLAPLKERKACPGEYHSPSPSPSLGPSTVSTSVRRVKCAREPTAPRHSVMRASIQRTRLHICR